MDLTVLVSSFRQFVAAHPETKKFAFAHAIGVSPSGLSMILNGANRPTATQALAMLNVVRGGSTRIVGLQENIDLQPPDSNTDQRIELNERNLDYLEKFNRKIDCTVFDNSNAGRVAREGADPSDDPANGDGDITSNTNRKAGAGAPGSDDPSLGNLLSQLDNLYRTIGKVLATSGIQKAIPNKAATTGRNTSQKFRAR